MMRKAGPVNEKRIELLDRYAAESGGAPLPIEKVLDAFFAPMVETANANPQFVRVMGRIVVEGLLPAVVQKSFQPMFAKFVGALRQAVPDIPEEEFQWRIHFMTGVIAHTLFGAPGAQFPGADRTVDPLSRGGFPRAGAAGGRQMMRIASSYWRRCL